jgi:hypothetical protein
MIFGFNTEVKFEDTVYHIQSEARQRDQLLQTQVFIKGRCVGKHTASYADRTSSDFTEEHLHDMLKDQHRGFVVAAREGRLEEMLDVRVKPPEPAPVAEPKSQAAAADAAQPVATAASEPATPRPASDTDPLDL